VGIVCAVLCFAWLCIYRILVMHHFGGVTGDTSGFFLQIIEILILFSCIIGRLICA